MFSVVADRLTRGVDRATQNVVGRRDPASERFEDFVLGYDAITSSNQVEEQVEYLGLNVEIRSVAAEYVEARVEFKRTEPVYGPRNFRNRALERRQNKLRSTFPSMLPCMFLNHRLNFSQLGGFQ